jgi:hypothetical protein
VEADRYRSGLVYVSTAAYPMKAPDLEFLLVESRRLNHCNDITGVLLHSEGNFMQCFEGPEQAVIETYERIRASRRHKDLVELMNERVRTRSFSAWDMGLAEPAVSMLLALSIARWTSQAAAGSKQPFQSPGFELLQGFWRGVQRSAVV